MKKFLRLVSAFSCLAVTSGLANRIIDFESDALGVKPAGWTFSGDSSDITIVGTTTSGDYVGGQAIRTDNSGASFAAIDYAGPNIVSLQADFLWDWSESGTPTLVIYAWDDDDGDGFQSAERTIGFGLDNDGQFELSSEAGELTGNSNFSANTWYRLTMTWGEPDGTGSRLVTLNAIDLTNSNDLGVVSSITMTAGDFGVAPSEWDGVAFRMTRGTIDNIQITSEIGSDFTYIDATPVNTTLNSDPANSPGGVPLVAGSNYVNDGSGGSGNDNLWTYRTDASFSSFEGGTAFESDNGSSAGDRESTPDLITTVTFPTAGTYEVVAVFTRGNNRDIAAKIGMSPDSGDVFFNVNALDIGQGIANPGITFDNTFDNGRGENSGAAYLGTVTTTSDNEEVAIFINGLASTPITDSERTQYDGIGYRSTTVEPPREPRHRDVFILAGQSNCDGRGLASELTGPLAEFAGPQPDVLIHYTNPSYTHSSRNLYQSWVTLRPGFSRAPGYSGSLPSPTFGMEIGAAKVLSEFYPNPAFIKIAQGGTALGNPGQDWYPAPINSPDAGPLYKALLESTASALAELKAAGDTYTVRGFFWHQGESDTNRTAVYNGLLADLVEGLRNELSLPNLRFTVGELASTKAQAFRDVQWEIARTETNSLFISSSALVTTDNTHFDTASDITMGQRLGFALRPDRTVLDFEAPICAVGPLNRQDECSATLGLGSPLEVVSTTAQGEYPGGQAAGHPGASGAFHFTRRNFLPLESANSLQADFFGGDAGFDDQGNANSSLLVAGWIDGAGKDGQFSEAETAIGLGLDSSGRFRVQVGAESLTSSLTYQIDRWYRLTLTWSEPNANGDRTLNLFARDLSSETDFNGGAPVLILNVDSGQFSGDPVRWSGIGCRATRGLIDNIQISPSGFAAWSTTLYPALTGGLQDDDDNDGISNALEFAFGLNPLSGSSSTDLPMPVFGTDNATVSFSPLQTQPEIDYLMEWSRDLETWTNIPATRTNDQIEFTIPTAGESSIFLRHKVQLSE